MRIGARFGRGLLGCLTVGALALGCGGARAPVAERDSRAGDEPAGTLLAGDPTTLVPVESDDLVVGSIDAEVTVIAFLDAAQPESVEAFALLESLLAEDSPQKVRLVVKHFPEGASTESLPAALAIQSAKLLGGDGAALEYLRRLLARQRDLGPGTYAELTEGLGIDRGAFGRMMSSEAPVTRVGGDVLLARKLGLRGGPILFVNGRAILGLPSKVQLESLVVTEAKTTRILRVEKSPAEAYAQRTDENTRRSMVDALAGETSANRASLPGGVDHSGAKIPVLPRDPVWGEGTAPVTIVEFSDFECPFCSRVRPTLERIKREYGPRKVRIVFKHNPLPFHKNARPAADAAAAVVALGGSAAFWKFHDRAFENGKELDEARFRGWAAESGVDAEEWSEAYRKGTYANAVDAGMELARAVGAFGTPAFRINGVTLSGAQPFEKFQEVIDAELAAVDALARSGTRPAEIYPARVAKNFDGDGAAREKTAQPSAPPAPPDTKVWSVPVDADDPVLGPRDALVTIVEFSDFQCPFCRRVSETVKRVVENYGKDVRVVWKDNPLPFHPRALPVANLARAIREAKGDQAFWKAHDKLFELQPHLEDSDLEPAFADSGVPWRVLSDAMTKNKFAAKIEDSQELASLLDARGTPHFFINGRRLAGAQPFEKFQEVIDSELALAKQRVALGTPRKKLYEALVKEGESPPPPERKNVPKDFEDAPFRGNPKGKILIVEFGDFECPFCARAKSTMDALLKDFGGEVKFVWVNMPLPFHKGAMLAAEAAHEVFVQKGNDAFWLYHDRLLGEQRSAGGLGRENLERFAAELGCDMPRFRAALDVHSHEAKLARDIDLATSLGVTATPSFFVNGFSVTGAQPFAVFRRTIRLAKKNP